METMTDMDRLQYKLELAADQPEHADWMLLFLEAEAIGPEAVNLFVSYVPHPRDWNGDQRTPDT